MSPTTPPAASDDDHVGLVARISFGALNAQL
jgi:hypothetical protein